MSKKILPFLPTNNDHKENVHDDLPALFDDNSSKWLTYGDLRAKIEAISTAFESDERGVILLCISRSIDGVIAYLAAAHSDNAIILTATENHTIDQLIENYNPNWIVTTNNISNNKYTKTTWTLDSLSIYKSHSIKNKIHSKLYLTLLTSGSTGSQKGVRLSYKNIASNTNSIIKSLNISSDNIALTHLPLSYSFGLSVLHTQLAIGARCILSNESMMSSALWKIAREQKATLFSGVPYQYEMLMRLGLNRINVPTLRVFLQAGGKLRKTITKQLLDEISKIENGELHIMYGQTEASPRISSFPLHEYPEKIGSVGKVLDKGHISIEGGELFYQGPNVMLGYSTSIEDLALGDETEGILRTGDLASIDQDGFIKIIGRKHRFAKLYGQRIALDDLEKIASIHAFTIAIEGKEKAILYALKQSKEQCEIIKADVIKQTDIPPTWIEVKSIDALPHKPNGKIDYTKLRNITDV